MLEMKVPQEIEQQVQDLIVGSGAIAFTEETFDNAIETCMSFLRIGNQGDAVYADQMVFGQGDQQDTHKELYKPNAAEIKTALTEGNSTLMLQTPNSACYCLNFIKVGDKNYLQLLTPSSALALREQHNELLASVREVADKELTVWERICNFFSDWFHKRPGEAAARKEAYRSFSENLQNAVDRYRKTHDEVDNSFRIRASQMNQRREQLEREHQKKVDIEETQAFLKKEEESAAKFDKAQQKKQALQDNLKQEILKNKENEANLPKEEENPESEQDKKIREEQLKADAESAKKAEALRQEEARQKALQEALEKAENEWREKLRLKAQERDEALKTYTELGNLYDAQGKQLMEMYDLKSKIDSAYNLKWDQEKRLDQQILDAKVDLPIMKSKANDLIAKKNRLTERESALNDSQKDLEKEKKALDHFRLEYEQAKTQLEQQNTNLSQLEKDIAPLRVTAQQYLENTYQKEMQSRQEAFDKAREAREKQILDKKQSMETIDAQIKSLYKQHGRFGWPADATKNYNQLQSVMDTLKSEYKQLETDGKNALKDYEAKNKELQKEYQKPTPEKLKETDEFLKSSLKDYNDKVTARNEAEARMNRMKTAFENQQAIYQNKKTTFDQEQNQYNIDKESITFACTEAVNAYNKAVTQNKERKALVATLKAENAETYKLLAKANKDYANLRTEQQNTRQKREEQGRVVDRLGSEHSQMLKAKPTLENLSQQPQQQPQPQQVKPQAGPSMGGGMGG